MIIEEKIVYSDFSTNFREAHMCIANRLFQETILYFMPGITESQSSCPVLRLTDSILYSRDIINIYLWSQVGPKYLWREEQNNLLIIGKIITSFKKALLLY